MPGHAAPAYDGYMKRGAVCFKGRPLERVMKKSLKWLAVFTVVLAAQAQVSDQVRRATISGSGGTSGKCTIEVRVDIAAEVDVYGDSARLRTLAGQPATFTRMECNNPLPYRMTDFRFRGIDGRGTQRLVQDPRNNNSIAVIRIDDPRERLGRLHLRHRMERCVRRLRHRRLRQRRLPCRIEFARNRHRAASCLPFAERLAPSPPNAPWISAAPRCMPAANAITVCAIST